MNWKSELRRFIGYEEFAKYITTRKRLNRRFPLMPGFQVQRKAHMLVAVDSSGSVGDDEFAKFFKEIDFMRAAGIKITYVECDADIQKVAEYKKRPTIERIGYGGTDFRPVFELAASGHYKSRHSGQEFFIKHKIDAVIYCTDGAGSYPQKISCPTIWVMTAQHQDYGWNEKLGKKLVMVDD